MVIAKGGNMSSTSTIMSQLAGKDTESSKESGDALSVPLENDRIAIETSSFTEDDQDNNTLDLGQQLMASLTPGQKNKKDIQG
jgi:hypothetical protein